MGGGRERREREVGEEERGRGADRVQGRWGHGGRWECVLCVRACVRCEGVVARVCGVGPAGEVGGGRESWGVRWHCLVGWEKGQGDVSTRDWRG